MRAAVPVLPVARVCPFLVRVEFGPLKVPFQIWKVGKGGGGAEVDVGVDGDEAGSVVAECLAGGGVAGVEDVVAGACGVVVE